MSPDEEVKKAGLEGSKRPPGHNPPGGGVLHQRRSLPYSLVTLGLAGCAMVGGLWYLTIYAKKKPEPTALDVARLSTGMAAPEHTRRRPRST
ncbi:hypothetical protein ACJIZ3_004221 [Penstemon smallii]|uniref:Transmembrane protein n=1 Tax=Penstemon smallii TaxID=265156 RepID=A0ABD3S1H4_9LAMI